MKVNRLWQFNLGIHVIVSIKNNLLSYKNGQKIDLRKELWQVVSFEVGYCKISYLCIYIYIYSFDTPFKHLCSFRERLLFYFYSCGLFLLIVSQRPGTFPCYFSPREIILFVAFSFLDYFEVFFSPLFIFFCSIFLFLTMSQFFKSWKKNS